MHPADYFSLIGPPEADIYRFFPEGLPQYPAASGLTCADLGVPGWEEVVGQYYFGVGLADEPVLSVEVKQEIEGYCQFFSSPPVDVLAVAALVWYQLNDNQMLFHVDNVHRMSCVDFLARDPEEQAQFTSLLAQQRGQSEDVETMQAALVSMCSEWRFRSVMVGYLPSF